MSSALEEIRNKNILSACSLFENLPKLEKGLGAEIDDFVKLTIDAEIITEKERFHILELTDEIMISLNEIPRESITLPIFKCWCDLLIFQYMFTIIMECDNSCETLINVVNSVAMKVFRFFFRGLIHFKKINIKIVDANESEISVDSSKEELLMLVIKRIKNYETIQDLIDNSPNAECPVCLDVTFTESTEFLISTTCNHLVCLSCALLIAESSDTLVEKYIIFLSFD